MPWLAGVAVLGVASMAGLPPMLGFIGKEAAFSAFLTGARPDLLVDAVYALFDLVLPNPVFRGIAFYGELLLQFWA